MRWIGSCLCELVKALTIMRRFVEKMCVFKASLTFSLVYNETWFCKKPDWKPVLKLGFVKNPMGIVI